MRTPLWFQEFLENDYYHLEKKVDRIKTNVKWLMVLVPMILASIIAGAIAIIIAG